jgi:hypothetical protein
MPAFELLRPFVNDAIERDRIAGELFVRDGLPLLFLRERGLIEGFRIDWQAETSLDGYRAICEFEPGKHYMWTAATLESGTTANVLQGRFPNKGNPQPLHSAVWRLTDDPAFGEGLAAVRAAAAEIDTDNQWNLYFPGLPTPYAARLSSRSAVA